MKITNIWHNGNFISMTIGQNVTIFRCGSGRTTYGEKATLSKVTTQHLIFTTESGAVVKTKRDNLHAVIGKAKKEHYVVSLKTYEDFTDMIHETVKFWNPKTCKFETK